MSSEVIITARKRLDSWKEIADYLGRDVRTAMRWERSLGLPVHRVPGGLRGGVFALVEEIDSWLQALNHQLPEPALNATDAPRRSKIAILIPSGLALAAVLIAVFMLQRTSNS